MSGRRYLCLWLPFLPTDRLRSAGEGAGSNPGATVQRVGNSAFLAALDRTARERGLRSGMTLASARAICPDLTALPHDPDGDRARLYELALWCDRFTPLVAVDGVDGLMLDTAGCDPLFETDTEPGEAVLIRQARDGLAALGFEASAALASTSGAAAALARYGGRKEWHVAPDAKLSDVLSDLPVTALSAVEPGLAQDVFDGLVRVGLRRIGDLVGLPRAALAARFGLALASALDKALGQAPRPIAPRPIRPPYRVRLRFPDPIGDTPDIEAALHRLLDRLCRRLGDEGRGCRRLDWTLYRADRTEQSLTIGTARPARDPDRLFRLFAEKLKTVEPGYGVDSMLLAATGVEACAAAQEDGIGAVTGYDRTALETVIDRLGNRLGADNVFRLAPVDSHLPDRAQTRTVALSDKSPSPWPTGRDRPLRLFNAPYPIEDLGGHSFRIFGRRTALRLLRGPERIAPEWWRKDAFWAGGARDYYDVEDETGRRFWIYSEAGNRPVRWYLHGLF